MYNIKIRFWYFVNISLSHNIGHCYEKIKLETKEMQDAIQKELGLSPVEENVIVLYDGEKDQKTDEFWKVLKVLYIDHIIIIS